MVLALSTDAPGGFPLPAGRRMERSLPLAEAVEEYLADLAIRGSPLTVTNYRSGLRQFLASSDCLTVQSYRAYLTSLIREGRSNATVNARGVAVRGLARWMVMQGYLLADPTAGITLPRAPKPPHRYHSADTLRRLYAAADGPVRLVVALMASSGLRRAEVASLRWQDVDYERGELTVLGKGSKWRTVAPGETVMAMLAAYPRKGPLIFGVTPDTVGDWLDRLRRKTGIFFRPHELRHSFAVLFLEASGEDAATLQDALGHSRSEMTLYYVRDVRRRSSLRKMKTVGLGDQLFG